LPVGSPIVRDRREEQLYRSAPKVTRRRRQQKTKTVYQFAPDGFAAGSGEGRFRMPVLSCNVRNSP